MAESKKNRAIAAELIAKASRDSGFRQQLLADPKAALIAAGAEIPADVQIRALENTQRLRYIVLPALGSDGSELSDAQLAAIAGGGSTANVTNTLNVQTVASVTTEVQVTETSADAAAEVGTVCVIVLT